MVNFPGLGTMLVLPIARVRLFRLQKQGAGASAFFFFKPVLLFSPFEPRSLQQRQLPKKYIIYNFGTASYQMPLSILVLNGDCAVQKSEVAKL